MKARRHRRKRHAKAVSIDVGWSRTNWKRTAIAWSNHKTGRVKVDLLEQNEWLEDWVRELVMPEGLVAINIPIQGCADLAMQDSFRPVDRGLIKVGIPLLPSAQAGTFGSEIADRIRAAVPDCRVVEVYPYGVLRVLWSLQFVSDVRPVKLMEAEDWEEYLNARAWKRNPPRYKRARKRLDMIRALKNAITVLDGSHYGRAFDEVCDDPLSLMTRSELLRMSDAFDVLLGLVALDRHVNRSPFARVYSVPGKTGEILGLGDVWLWKKWSQAVRTLAG
jgi:predicted nuclease with RNAse H fold